jgi:WD40 repeat protein/tetratricopeptide (TPR) repeat protein
MVQKAICPRGHIWDPSTLAGLPPTETPRCPICGEEEKPRAGNALARLRRWCQRNPALAGSILFGLCLVLANVLLLTILSAREGGKTAIEQAEKAQLEAQQEEAKLRALLKSVDAENKELKHLVKAEAKRRENREKEFKADLVAAEKATVEMRRQRDDEIKQRKLVEELGQSADQLRQDALNRRAETERKLVKMYTAAGTRLMEGGDLSASMLWFAEALRLAEKEKLPTQMHRLRLAAVLARCPRPVQVSLHEKKINVVQLSLDGKRVLTAAANGVEVWQAATGKRIGGVLAHPEAVTHAAFSPDGKRVLTAAADMTLHLWDVEMGQELFAMLQLKGPAAGLAFSADGKRFLTVTDKAPMGATEVELHVYDATSGEAIREGALGSEIVPLPPAFSPDGQHILTVCQDRCARIWDIATGKQIGSAFPHAAALVRAMFSADGERVLTASADGAARVWKAKTGEPLTPFLNHGAALRGASIRADGKFALTIGDDRSVRVWDANKGEAAGPDLRHNETVNDAFFSPDGRYVLTTCEDGAVRLWDFPTAEETLPALRHEEPIRYAAFTRSGDGLLTLSGGVMRLWDLTSAEAPFRPKAAAGENPPGLVVFSPDGKRVLRATDSAVRVYDAKTNQPVGGTLPHKDKVTAAAFSADGKRLLTICHVPNGDQLEGHVRIWETTTGALLGQPLDHPSSVLEASFSRDGRRVLTACRDDKARLWDVEKNILIGQPMDHKQGLSQALFLPDGKHLLTVDADGGLRLWDAATAEAVGPTWGHRKPIHHLAFSPDGKQLVTASEDGTASVWEANTGGEIASTPVQSAAVIRAAFSPDGKRIVTVSGDHRVRVWEAKNGKPVSPSLRHRAGVTLAVFSDDGNRLVTVAADGLRVWDASSGELLCPLMRTAQRAGSVSDGNAIADTSALFRTDDRPAAELVRVAEVLSAERLTDAGEPAPLDRGEFMKAWQEVQRKHAKDFSPSPERLAAWHRRGAVECENQHLWIGALRHLDYLVSAGASTDLYARRGRANLELKRWEAAKTDYTRALAGEGKRWDLWAGRAAVEAAIGNWKEAAADYSKAIELKGDRAELWAGRGRIEAERGDWRKAAADFGKAIQLGEQDAAVSRQHVLTLLAGGDEADYRRWCNRLVKRFSDSKDTETIGNLVWTCTLKADAVSDWKPLLKRAQGIAAANPQAADPRRQLAMLLYRAEKFDAALDSLQELTRLASDEEEERDWLLRAMVEQRLGRAEEAKKRLDKAEQIRKKRDKKERRSWEDRFIDETLRREAQTLVKAGSR